MVHADAEITFYVLTNIYYCLYSASTDVVEIAISPTSTAASVSLVHEPSIAVSLLSLHWCMMLYYSNE